MKAKKLIWQLYPSYLLVIFIALILLVIYSSSAFKTFYLAQTSNDLRARTLLMETQVTPYFKSREFLKLRALISEQGQKTSTRFTMVDLKGEVLVDSDERPEKMDNHAQRPEIVQALSGNWGMATRYSRTLRTRMLYVAKAIQLDNQIVGVMRSSIPINDLDETLNGLMKKTILWGVLISIFSAMVGFFVSRKISQPIQEFAMGADEISTGNFEFQLPVPNTQEFKQLADAFNNMSFQIKDRIQTVLDHVSEKETILSTMIEGVITVDVDGAITTMNQSAKTYFCIESDDVKGRSVGEVVRNTAIQTMIHQALASNELVQEDIALLHPQKLILHGHGMALKNAKQECVGALIVLHDITRIKRLEKMRQNFVANVSHELKTPITLIKGFLETLFRSDFEDKNETEEFLTIIQDHTIRLESIIDDLLSLSKIEQEQENKWIETERDCMNEVIERAIVLCQKKAHQKALNIKFESESGKKVMAKMNVSLMEQAVINLLDNAIKYSSDNAQIDVLLAQSSGENIVSVRDQGCGISQEHIPHLFERFYRVDAARSRELGGTGLGLAIVKHIAESHSGRVSVTSEENKGSQFSIYIPMTHHKEEKNV